MTPPYSNEWFLHLGADLLFVGVALGVYYGFLLSRFEVVTTWLALRSGLTGRFSLVAVEDMMELALSGVTQMIFLLVIVYATRVDVVAALRFNGGALLLGALLGIAEMGASSMFSRLVIEVCIAFKKGGGATLQEWLSSAKGGWMRIYLNTFRIAPWWFVVGATLLYVAVEELVFRTVLITYFAPYGLPLSVVVAALFFMAVQAPNTPGWRTAIFPIIGGLVVGVTHGALFALTGDVTPLIVAHFIFFIAAVF